MTPKLKAMTGGCKRRLPGAVLLAVLLAGCPTRPAPPPARLPPPAIAPHLGRPYEIASAESLLTIRVYRGGSLAAAGHNHLIASRSLAGTIYVPADPLAASFEVRFPVAALSVDEPGLRAAEDPAEFPPDVPDSAREGTRRNMLGEALLAADEYPQVRLRCERLEPGAAPGTVLAHIETLVHGRTRSVRVPVRWELAGATLVASGEAPLTQSELGLTPFSALLGALRVEDGMQVRFRIVAHAAAGAGGAR
jgi:hypothetical protein